MAIDIITGKYFIPKFKGQRTKVDITARGDESEEEYLAIVQSEIEQQLLDKGDWKSGYLATTPAQLQAAHDAEWEKALASDPSAERHIVTPEEEAQLAERLPNASKEIMRSLVGGYNPDLDYGPAGPNLFLRTEAGLEGWKGMDRSGQDTGGRATLNPEYRAGGASTVIGIPYTDRSGAPTGDTAAATNEFGAWIGTEDMTHIGNFVDTDGDGIDDRWQSGPGQPDSRKTESLVPAIDTRDDEAAVESKYADFVASLQTVGIQKDFAESLWDWAKGKLIDPDYPLARIAIDVYDTDAFIQRFPAISAQRDMENVTPFTPAEYIEYETFVMGQLAANAVTGQNIDFDGLVTSLITNNVGTAEVSQRLAAAKRVMGNVPEQIKSTYMDWYGPEAEANLMKTFLDPDDNWGGTWSEVDVAVGTAEVGGWIKQRLRFDETEAITKESAGAINRLGLSAAQIWANLDTLRSQEALFAENIDETTDMRILDEGLRSQFDFDDEAEDLLSKRLETRSARFMGGGGAIVSGATTGFGAANA
jgi:hypothetical protein